MAYIEKSVAAAKRKAIRAMYPAKKGWKWSVTVDNHSSLEVRLMQYPKEYDFGEYENINHYYIDRDYSGKEEKVLSDVYEIMKDGHWDKSDIQSDYFHCAWYNNMAVGRWDRPAVAV